MTMEFDLLEDFQRPAIMLKFGNEKFRALVDTGAFIPVYTGNIEILKSIGGKFEKRGVSFGGFGGRFTGDLYRIDLKFGRLKYEQLPIICAHNPNMPFTFVLSATMFAGFKYTIDNIEHRLIVDTNTDDSTAKLRYKTKSGMYIVLSED